VYINCLVIQSELAENSPFTPFDKLRTGFDTLRANGAGVKSVKRFRSCWACRSMNTA